MKRTKSLYTEVPPLAPLPPRPEALPILWRWVAVAVMVLSLAFAAGHSATTPILAPQAGSLINAPDEPAHWGYVQILAREGRLPRQGDSTYEWHQPPLYYSLAASLFPLGPHAVRWLTLLMGCASTLLIFYTVRRMFPSDPVLAVVAMGLAALLPMRQGVYASVGNDALLELLCSAFFAATVPAFTNGFTLRRAGLMGLVVGATLLTKASGVLLIPVAVYTFYLLWRKAEERPRSIALGACVLFVAAISISLPVFLRNASLYGQPIPLKAFKEEFANTSTAEKGWIGQAKTADIWTGELRPSDEPMTRARYLGLVANWSFRTYYGAFTPLQVASLGIPVFPHPQFYLVFLLTALASASGLARLHFKREDKFTGIQLAYIWLMFAFAGLTVLSFLGFTWTYFQAQGRYLYPAMLPIATLSALGLRAALPTARRDAVCLAVLALFALLSAAFLWVYVQPAYGPALPGGAAS